MNALLREYLDERDIVLVDMKLEFGRHHGKILLADEICPDTCRFWDKSTGEKLDKDRFRRDLGRRRGRLPGGGAAHLRRGRVMPGLLARVYVTPKRGILDPQGKAVQHSLHALGFAEVGDVRVGKYIELRLRDGEAATPPAPGSARCASACSPTA